MQGEKRGDTEANHCMTRAGLTQIETIAAAFRAALVPTVADRMPWPKMGSVSV